MLLFAFLPAKLKLAKSDIALFCMMTPRDKIVSRTNPQKEPFPPILQLILYLSLSFNLSRFSPALLNELGAHTEGVRFLGQGCAVSGDRPAAGWNSSTVLAVLGSGFSQTSCSGLGSWWLHEQQLKTSVLGLKFEGYRCGAAHRLFHIPSWVIHILSHTSLSFGETLLCLPCC